MSTPSFDANNLDSILAAKEANQAVIAAKLAATKSQPAVPEKANASGASEIPLPEPQAVEEIPQAAIDVSAEQRIKQLESINKELLSEFSDDIEMALPEVPDGRADEKLKVLETINQMLTDAINSEHELSSKPKYGKFDGPIVPVHIKGKSDQIWIDVDGVNIDTGESVQLTPGVIKQLEEAGERKASEWLAKNDAGVEPHSYYVMSKKEYDRETEREYPVYILPKQPGPAWNDSILYGAAGNVIRKASQYNESHPAGMLVDFLVSLGSIIGRGPYFNINETKHYTNEFMARVGDSSNSRKGTGRDAIDGILRLVDPGWYSNRVESGFGSGEAIINRVRDAVIDTKLNHRTGKFDNIMTPGVTDKRLCIREGELASVFVLAGKAESRADIVLRDGWDGKALRNVVKGKSKDGFSLSAKCEEPHLSISGDTTISELRAKMPSGADENGFGNRFIYVYVYRVKDCPQGGPSIDWTQEIVDFQQVVQYAKTIKHVSMTAQARKWWNNNYSDLEHNGPSGLAGKMTRRGAAHIRRIAMLYALTDMTDQIELEHFHAAKKLWDYCSESAMFIFSGVTKEQLRIANWIGLHGGQVTYQQVRDDLYSRNRLAAEIKTDLDGLVKARQLFVKAGMYVTGQNVGRLVT